MNEVQVDLAHAVALGSIDDEDHNSVQELLDSEDPALRAAFLAEVQETGDVLTALAEVTATAPPASLRDRVLAGAGARPRR
ncbi:hypothetical protein AB0H76_36615 [Nocardia sp. NPDC050712]|uniref:RskA family anti-sigma factor n=1 Tax=Nocardia sp. NPDC050712 TaxID=3155518 RepID=UPI00340F2C4C